MKIDVKYTTFVLLFYTLIFKCFFESTIVLPGVGYIDEFIALLAVPLVVYNVVKKDLWIRIAPGWGIFLFLFLCFGLLGSFIFGYQANNFYIFIDAFTCLKFWLTIYVGQSLFQNFDLAYYAEKIYFHLRTVIWIHIILILLDYILGIFPATIRYGLRAIQLFYGHPSGFVATSVFLTVILVAIRPYIRHSDKYFIVLLLFQISSLRTKAFATVLIFAVIYFYTFIRRKKINLRILFVLIPVSVAVAWQQINYYFFSSLQSDSARYQLLSKAIQIAGDHFPLGTGFSTYASFYSASGDYYSPLYYDYGLSQVNGLRKENSGFVSDSFWPMIIGQSGWFGFFFYVVALLILSIKIYRLRRYSQSYQIGALLVLIYLLISSAAESAFVNPIAIPFAIFLGVLFASADVEKKRT